MDPVGAGIARLVEQLFEVVDIGSDDCQDAGEKLGGDDPVARPPVPGFVAEIGVLLPQSFGLRRECRHLPGGSARRCQKDKVARRQASNPPIMAP